MEQTGKIGISRARLAVGDKELRMSGGSIPPRTTHKK